MADDSIADATNDSTACLSLGAEAAWGFSIRLPDGRGIASAVREALAGADAISRDGSCFGATGVELTAAVDMASAGGWLADAISVGGGIGCRAVATGAASCTGGAAIATGGASGSPYDQITA